MGNDRQLKLYSLLPGEKALHAADSLHITEKYDNTLVTQIDIAIEKLYL